MRFFIALDLPETLSGWVWEQQQELKRFLPEAGLRWSPSEQWHVTLRFLGEWPEHKAAIAVAAMKRATDGLSPFLLSLGKPGSFSGPRMGTVWLGVELGAQPLAKLVVRLNETLEAEGFLQETRPFRGHVTLARSRAKIPSAVLRRFSPTRPCPSASIDRLHLYQSVLSSDGAHYIRLHTVFARG